MGLLEWDDQFCIGFGQFDEHHQCLVALLNTSYDAVRLNNSFTVMAVLDELRDYSTYHFAAEEDKMRELGYPDLETHLRQHEFFSNQVNDFIDRISVEEPLHKVAIVTFLREWLVDHILKMDRELVAFIIARGAM